MKRRVVVGPWQGTPDEAAEWLNGLDGVRIIHFQIVNATDCYYVPVALVETIEEAPDGPEGSTSNR